MATNDAVIQSQAASLRNLENQVGQLANELKNRPPGTLPSNTESPRRDGKEHCKAITLRGGKTLEAPEINEKNPKELVSRQEEENNEQRNVEKENREAENSGENSEKSGANAALHINIPLVEALEQMPNYVKFMKDMLTKKRRFGEFETVALTRECSTVLQNKLPPKLKDPGSFTIPCSIGNQYFGKALCDLGASINLMPMSIFKKLGIGEARPTTVSLQLADRSIAHPEGKIEDVLVKVDKFIFPVDFIVLDYEADLEVPIILGRPFLATGRTLIDVQNGELTMRSTMLDDSNLEDEIEEEWAWIETKQGVGKQKMQFESLDMSSREFKLPKFSVDESPALDGEERGDQVARCRYHLPHFR
ncbi:hypothetical protein UlMin_008913 [Ulmus minor]